MFNLTSHIVVTDPATGDRLEFRFAHNIEIEHSWKNLTDTAFIEIARKIRIKNGITDDLNSIIKRGNKVEIYLGYDGELRLEFTGYVARVEAKIPFVIHCEDEIWKLKQTSFNQSFRKVKLKDLIASIYQGPAQVIDMELGAYTIKKATAAAVLEDLRKNYGLVSYFTNELQPMLKVGFAYDFKSSRKVIYHFQRNIIDHDLEYRRKEDIRIRVKGVSIFPDNTKVELFEGDQDGDERTLHYYRLPADELKKIVKSEIDRLKTDGYRNSFTSFGQPYAEHNDIAMIQDDNYPERTGEYLIDKVKVKFGVDGFRRTIEPGVKV